ncbi:MAG: purine-nucleoside phosphorylase [Bacteroidota bacterium]|jgi:purine-nucleoside phosphorylase|nr:purine-nucleoside phosphorylase [Bacteroidia bacterium]
MSLHINAEKGSIAPIVLLPGDPLRAKYIAENWLKDPKLVSTTRNMFYFTGEYKGKRVTVGGSGMGCPSIGIYSFELYTEYQVETIIRIGTAGSYLPNLKTYELVNAEFACSESTYAHNAFGFEGNRMVHQGPAFERINEAARRLNQPVHAGTIHSNDVFYRASKELPEIVAEHNCLAVEMEAFALFANARYLKKTAGTLLTISDVIPTGEVISPEAREKSLKPMIELALEACVEL